MKLETLELRAKFFIYLNKVEEKDKITFLVCTVMFD